MHTHNVTMYVAYVQFSDAQCIYVYSSLYSYDTPSLAYLHLVWSAEDSS